MLSYYSTSGAGLLVRFEEFREMATHVTDDPGVIVVEYELTATVTAAGVRSPRPASPCCASTTA